MSTNFDIVIKKKNHIMNMTKNSKFQYLYKNNISKSVWYMHYASGAWFELLRFVRFGVTV